MEIYFNTNGTRCLNFQLVFCKTTLVILLPRLLFRQPPPATQTCSQASIRQPVLDFTQLCDYRPRHTHTHTPPSVHTQSHVSTNAHLLTGREILSFSPSLMRETKTRQLTFNKTTARKYIQIMQNAKKKKKEKENAIVFKVNAC